MSGRRRVDLQHVLFQEIIDIVIDKSNTRFFIQEIFFLFVLFFHANANNIDAAYYSPKF